jgi:HEAT repeat protein
MRQEDRAGQEDLAGQEDRAGQEDLAKALAELTSGEDERAETVVPQLAALAELALPTLEALFHSPAAERRWWAVRVLAEIDSPQASRMLHQALGDPDASVRQCAALALRHSPTPEAIPDLLASLASPDRLLARLAADALAAAGPSAVPQLIEVLENGPQAARLEAVRALAHSGDPGAIPALFQALDEESALMEYWAGEGLDRLGVGMSFFNP